ncbi:MAG TPA: FHA domain-containing protein [bacterium]|nr:FHA domain-containing protein [bacterium]
MEEDWNIVLSVLESPESSLIGQQKVFTTSPIIIGRAEDCDFIVTDPTVSRQHSTLRITNDYSRVFITDQSTHGTLVSGKPVPKGLGSGFTIHDGDSIKIGNTLLKFELRLKGSVQSTFIGEMDRSFLDKTPEEQQKPIEKNEDIGAIKVSTPVVEEKKRFSPLYIAVIVICVFILIYLLFFQS